MKIRYDAATNRRQFLKYLAASPLLAYWSKVSWAVEGPTQDFVPSPVEPIPETGAPISSPAEAIDVFDFEKVARYELSPAHYGYLATGVDDNATLRANREGFARIQLRPRRLVDIRQVDTSVELFGETWKTPISMAPVGALRAFHPDGDIAVGRAGRTTNHQVILTTVATASVEDVTKAHGGPIWFQLYPMWNGEVTRRLIKRAEAAGCPVCAITVDLPVGRNAETLERMKRRDPAECSDCHTNFFDRKPMFDGFDRALSSGHDAFRKGLTWDFARRVKDSTSMKVLIKGVVTGEDAKRCLDAGMDGLIVSNHGGRASASGRGTIEALPEVVAAVGDRIPVLLDSGIRRGTDIFKALALGAKAISIGRPYCWGLAGFGQPGVEAVLRMLDAELVRVMQMSGVTSLTQINASYVTYERD